MDLISKRDILLSFHPFYQIKRIISHEIYAISPSAPSVGKMVCPNFIGNMTTKIVYTNSEQLSYYYHELSFRVDLDLITYSIL